MTPKPRRPAHPRRSLSSAQVPHGTALANRVVRRLDGAEITLIDPRQEHLYQPGLSLVAAGLKPADYVVSQTGQWLPDGVTWLRERVAAVDPEAKIVETESGASWPMTGWSWRPGWSSITMR